MAPLACAGSTELPLFWDCSIQRFVILPIVLSVGVYHGHSFVRWVSIVLRFGSGRCGYALGNLDDIPDSDNLSFGVIPFTYYVCKVVLCC